MRFFKLIQRSLREFSLLCYLSLMVSVAIDRTRKKIITPVLYTQKKINPTKTRPKCEPKLKGGGKKSPRRGPRGWGAVRSPWGFWGAAFGGAEPRGGGWVAGGTPRRGELVSWGWGEGTPFNV